MTRADTTSAEFFEALYRRNPDPWSFASDAYEGERYAATLAALEGRRFAHGFEPGCSVGVLTAKLAQICDWVEAIDISTSAVQTARQRCGGLQNVEIGQGALPDAIPKSEFDLVVMSEIGYYFEEPELEAIGRRLTRALAIEGVLLATHWLGTSEDHVLPGDRVHEVLDQLPGLELIQAERHVKFRIDCWKRV